MSDRAALVTGASSGIGFAIARCLVAEGYAVTACARREPELNRAAEALGEHAWGVAADVRKEADVVRVLRQHLERFGRLDVLVNNAGCSAPAPWDAIDTSNADHEVAVNLRGTILVTREALPHLRTAGREHGKALVLNMSSVAGQRGQSGTPVYSATKAAVISLAESLQRAAASDGVQATAICPGLVATPRKRGAEVPAEEMLRPDDVAEAVRFLLRTSSACLVPEIVLNRRGAVR